MQTFEEQFNTRVNAFLGRMGLRPTTLGMKAVGDPSLLRQIGRGRSPSLRAADRVLAFIAAREPDLGGAGASTRAWPQTEARYVGGEWTARSARLKLRRAIPCETCNLL